MFVDGKSILSQHLNSKLDDLLLPLKGVSLAFPRGFSSLLETNVMRKVGSIKTRRRKFLVTHACLLSVAIMPRVAPSQT